MYTLTFTCPHRDEELLKVAVANVSPACFCCVRCMPFISGILLLSAHYAWSVQALRIHIATHKLVDMVYSYIVVASGHYKKECMYDEKLCTKLHTLNHGVFVVVIIGWSKIGKGS